VAIDRWDQIGQEVMEGLAVRHEKRLADPNAETLEYLPDGPRYVANVVVGDIVDAQSLELLDALTLLSEARFQVLHFAELRLPGPILWSPQDASVAYM
jgi:hypothetical protein